MDRAKVIERTEALANLAEEIIAIIKWSRLAAKSQSIPRSRQNPKIFGVDDAEVVRDRIAQLYPALRDFLP